MKHLPALALAVLMAASLAACSGKTAAPAPRQEDPVPATAPVQAQDPAPAEAAPQAAPAEAPDPLAFSDGDALHQFLVGTWQYWRAGGVAPLCAVTLAEDGTFRARFSHAEGGSERSWSGRWTLSALDERDLLPNWLCFESDVPMGDFLVTRWSLCDGTCFSRWEQTSNGESLFSLYYDTVSPTLRKAADGTVPEAVEPPRTNDAFTAVCWRVESAASPAVLWLDDTLPGAPYENDGRHVCAAYPLAPDAELRCPPSLFASGGDLARVETDGQGRVTALNWVSDEEESGFPLPFDRWDSVIPYLHLYMTPDRVRALLGEPDRTEQRDESVYGPETIYYYEGLILSFFDIYGDGGEELGSVTVSGSITLANGLHVGSSAEEVLSCYENDGLDRPIGRDTVWGRYLYGSYLYTYEDGYALPETYEQTGYRMDSEEDGSFLICYSCFTPIGDTFEQTELIFYLDGTGHVTDIRWCTSLNS